METSTKLRYHYLNQQTVAIWKVTRRLNVALSHTTYTLSLIKLVACIELYLKVIKVIVHLQGKAR